MKIAVLFDGGGLARLGLERAGHDCTGFELDPWKHCLSIHVGSGNSVLADAKAVDLSGFDAVWASPPCQTHSIAATQGGPKAQVLEGDFYCDADLLEWSEAIVAPVLWVENVDWHDTRHLPLYNAAQFLAEPLQNRSRRIGGNYVAPAVLRPYKRSTRAADGSRICPTVTATEHRGCATDRRRASRFYGRKMTIDECAYRQGFVIPDAWRIPPPEWPGSDKAWERNLYHAIGNGVPPYMAQAFGEAYPVVQDIG